MAHGTFEFRGKGIGYFWTYLVNVILIVITIGIYSPWAYVSVQRWICRHTYVDGKQLTFRGSGAGFFGTYLLVAILTVITLGIYGPWGACRILRWQTNNQFFADTGDNEAL